VFVYAAAIFVYFGCAAAEFQTEQAVIMINVLIISALGLSFLALSQPLILESRAVAQDLLMNCAHGAHTHKVATYATTLQTLRQSPACTGQASVEQCTGFQASQPMLGFLKQLESQSKCAGFCFTPVPAAAVPASSQVNQLVGNKTDGNSTDSFALLTRVAKPGQQPSPQVQLRSDGFGVAGTEQKGLASALLRFAQSSPGTARGGGALALLQQADQGTGAAGGPLQPLFGQSAYGSGAGISCEGASARALLVQAVSTGRTLYWEGIFLLVVAVVTGLAETGGVCFLASRTASAGKDVPATRQIVF